MKHIFSANHDFNSNIQIGKKERVDLESLSGTKRELHFTAKKVALQY